MVSKVPGPEYTIKFMLNTQEFIYTVDMFRDILYLPVETPKNLFVALVNIETIKAFMNRVDYQGVVDKVNAFYMKNLAQSWQTMFKVFNRCLTTRTSRHDQTKINNLQMFHAVINQTNVDYVALLWWDFMNNTFLKGLKRIINSMKDDIPLEIRDTDDFKEYEMVFMNVDVPMNQPQPVVSTQGTHRQQKVVEGEKDDDSKDRLEPGSHKDNPKNVDDDDEKVTDKVDKEEGATEDLIENNLKSCIAATIIEDRDAFCSEVPDLVSQEFNAQAPKIIEDIFKNYVQSNMKRSLQDSSYMIPTLVGGVKRKFEKSSTSNTSCRDDDIHSHHDDHQEDDAPPKGEKRVKRQKAFKVEKTVIDEDKVIPEDKKPELITELQDVDKRVPTIFNYERMKATLNDALSNHFKNAKEYAYHLEQTTNFMKNQIVWESRQEDIRRPVPRPVIFFGPQRNPNEPPKGVHDFQLGIESYQINLTAPTLTFPDEKRVMYLTEIVKFCDATLEKILKEVKLKIFQSEPWRKPPLIGELDRDILKAFERDITKRLSHREQMRRWESFVNGRPILPTMKRL
ncbi:hypothetical protein Tco_1337179 [Tanacetum coccineum]